MRNIWKAAKISELYEELGLEPREQFVIKAQARNARLWLENPDHPFEREECMRQAGRTTYGLVHFLAWIVNDDSWDRAEIIVKYIPFGMKLKNVLLSYLEKLGYDPNEYASRIIVVADGRQSHRTYTNEIPSFHDHWMQPW